MTPPRGTPEWWFTVAVTRRHELTDRKWEFLAPLIPRAATGRPCVTDRQVINGMVYKIRTGIA
ncbi:transposase [Streptomyces sp. NPDC000994]